MKYFLTIFLSLIPFAAYAETCPERASLKLEKKESFVCIYVGKIAHPDPLNPTLKREIPFRYYYTLQRKPAPLVFVYPSISQEIPLVEEALSRKLARAGYHAILVELVEDIAQMDRTPQQINDFFLRSNWSSAKLIDLVQNWPEVSPYDLHALGVSLGGIRGTIAYGEDRRLKKLALYVAGGNLPEIMAHTKVKLIQAYKSHWKEKLGIKTDPEFSDYLRQILTIDPLDSAKRRSDSDVFMVMAKDDQKVPYRNQLELYEAFGKPPSRASPFGHRVTGMSSILKFEEILRFLAE